MPCAGCCVGLSTVLILLVDVGSELAPSISLAYEPPEVNEGMDSARLKFASVGRGGGAAVLIIIIILLLVLLLLF